MLKKGIVVILSLFLLNLYGFSNNAAEFNDGILDLSECDISLLDEIGLFGTVEFYWNELIQPGEIDSLLRNDKVYVEIPSPWNSYKYNGIELPSTGAASYRMLVVQSKPYKELALKISSFGTANNIYVDGELLSSVGKVSLVAKDAEPGYATGVLEFHQKKDSCEIIIQISNYHYSKGGIWNSYNTIGEASIIQKSWNKEMYISLILVGCMLIFAFYHLGLYILNSSFRDTLYFGLFCMVMVIRIIVIDQILLIHLIPNFNWVTLIRLEYLTLIGGTLSFSLFVYNFYNQEFSKKFLNFIVLLTTLQGLTIALTSPLFFTKYLLFYQSSILIACSYIIVVVVKAIIRKQHLAFILLIGFSILVLTLVNDILYTNHVIDSIYMTSFGFVAFIFSQSFMLSARFSQLFVQSNLLAQRLETTNSNLELIVNERTAKIQDQNDLLVEQKQQIQLTNHALEQQNDEIKAQRDNLQKQHEIVQYQQKQITSSINYARHIQSAVIDSGNEQLKVAPESFVLFHPKAIVSGDFYWFKELEVQGVKYKIAAVVDCTGHGVPGAFMSILGTLFLNKVIAEIKTDFNASTILDKLRTEVKNLLNQQSASQIVKDGMDMALVIIDYQNMQLNYAGAHNPLFVIRAKGDSPVKEIEEYKGDNMPIGIFVRKEYSFTNHIIKVEPDDVIYMFTDGYHDQFGGPNIEKFKKRNFKQILLDIVHLPLSEQKLILDQKFNEWKGEHDQIDDVTVVGVKI